MYKTLALVSLLIASSIVQVNGNCGGCGFADGCCALANNQFQCYNKLFYTCAQDAFLPFQVLCGFGMSSCNRQCYSPLLYHCDNGQLLLGPGSIGLPIIPVPVTPPNSPINTASPVNTAPPASAPAGPYDLTIINSCPTTLWIDARADGEALDPSLSTTLTKLTAGSKVGYTIPATGLGATRFWAKYGCNDQGKNCLIGDSAQYFPEGGCPDGGCTPPIDSLFEATWGCKPGSACHAQNPVTWFDTSQVDGWTIPYQVTLNGDTGSCDNGKGLSVINATSLDLLSCPKYEDMSFNNRFPFANGLSLSGVDLTYRKNGQILGCMSPCTKLTHAWPQLLNPGQGPALFMCCPTPHASGNCNAANGCISSPDCRAGPIENSKYVKAVHDMAPGIYAYAYDDGVGLHTCPAGTVTYTMEFCPQGSRSYPPNSRRR